MNALTLRLLGLMLAPQSAPDTAPGSVPNQSPTPVVEAPTREPALSHDLFGVAIDAAGDMDGDGVTDLWVGDPSLYGPGVTHRGKAWCVSGRDGRTLLRIDAPMGALNYGWTIAGLDDVDGDGVRDVAVGCLRCVGARATEDSADAARAGVSAVHVHSGRDGRVLFQVRGAEEFVKVPWYSTAGGPTLCNVGDWNGDGVDDLAVGWCYDDADFADQGRVQVVSGRDGATIHTWLGLENHDRFGFALARLADLDRDGRDELAASAVADFDRDASAPETLKRTRSGHVRVLSSKGHVLRTLHPEDDSRRFGFSLARFPDSARERAPGIVVGSAHDLPGTIAVSRWNLDDGQPIQRILRPTTMAVRGPGETKAPERKQPLEMELSFATRLLAVPDRDGDGIADMLVTEPQSMGVGAYVISSSPSSGPRHTHEGEVLAIPSLAVDPFDHSHIGIGLCGLGDVDADGVEDFAISGASVRCGSVCRGVVVLVSGKSLRTLRHFVRAGRE